MKFYRVRLEDALRAYMQAHARECPSEILNLYGGWGCSCPLCHNARCTLESALDGREGVAAATQPTEERRGAT
jgi:hypothetical protein